MSIVICQYPTHMYTIYMNFVIFPTAGIVNMLLYSLSLLLMSAKVISYEQERQLG